MKHHLKYFFLGMLCLSYSTHSSAQEQENYVSHPDTLRIDMDNGQMIALAFKNIERTKFEVDFIKKWKESINKIQAALKLSTYETPIKVRLTNKLMENEMKDLVDIRPINQKINVFISRNGVLQDIARLSEVFFEINNISIAIKLHHLDQLNALKDIQLESLQQKLLTEKKSITDKRKAYYLSADLANNTLTDINIKAGNVADFLSINGGIGIGLFRDKIVPDFSLNASIGIRDKHGIQLHKFGLLSSFHYFFNNTSENNYDMHVNTFLTAFYKRNLSRSTLKDNWMGISIGYLVKKSGGYFQKNTYSVGLFLNADQSAIDIIPEIIITDDFKTVYPSIRLGLTF
jgi:hypothetical protein